MRKVDFWTFFTSQISEKINFSSNFSMRKEKLDLRAWLDCVQMTKVYWRLNVNCKIFQLLPQTC